MTIITTKTAALNYITDVMIIPDYYENGAMYIGLYNADGELYTDLSTYIYPVPPCRFFVEKGTEKEKFCKEQVGLFFATDETIKQGFNTYRLYIYNGFIH